MAITLPLHLDPHAAPPQDMKEAFKKFQKLNPALLAHEPDLIDIDSCQDIPEGFESAGSVSSLPIRTLFQRFIGGGDGDLLFPEAPVYSSRDLPGPLFSLLGSYKTTTPEPPATVGCFLYSMSDSKLGLLILPSLLPSAVQEELLSRIMHRDLSDQRHQTNLDFHHFVTRPGLEFSADSKDERTTPSFFSLPQDSTSQFQPKDSSVHKALSVKQVLEKKLRWITLGGQYDWTNKVYPVEQPPEFPPDIADLVEGLFPEMKAQAAIVNFYSPGDTLSLHRDVSEEVDRGLVSISLGCDCLFIIGLGPQDSKDGNKTSQENSRYLTLRLRSGDAVYMSKEARFAWHGVPKIINNTCPQYLADWPADADGKFEDWRGWMSKKRINLNIRQMYE